MHVHNRLPRRRPHIHPDAVPIRLMRPIEKPVRLLQDPGHRHQVGHVRDRRSLARLLPVEIGRKL